MKASAFLSRLLPDVPGCPDSLALQAVVDAAVELFDETDIWVLLGDPQRLVNNEPNYEPDSVTGARIGKIRSVWCGRRELVFKDSRQLTDVLPDWQTARSSEPTYYNSPDNVSIRVYPTPLAVTGSTISIEASYVPRDDMSGSTDPTIPDDLGMRLRDTILAGARSRLMITPERKWSNERLAAFYAAKFENDKAETRIMAIKARQPGTMSVRPREFG